MHYAGVSCDMDRLVNICEKYKIKIVEDAAQGVNAKYKDRFLGSIGDIGCYSFHETKNYSCGEGGALLINKSCELIKKAEIIREKGTNRSQFFRGEVDKYTWTDMGSSYLPSDILMGMLFSQFEELEYINKKRKDLYEQYKNALKDLVDKGKIKVQNIPDYSSSNYHMFYVIFNTEEIRDSVMKKLKENGIQTAFHYIPLHESPMGKRLGYGNNDNLKITEHISKRLLRLPMHMYLNQDDIDYIITNLYKIL